MTTTAAMAAATDSSLLHNDLAVLAVDKQRKERSPDEEDHFHNSERKGGLQHRTSLVDLQRQRVVHLPAILAEGAQRHPD